MSLPKEGTPLLVRFFPCQRANSAEIRCLPNNPSVAPRQLPLHKGAMGWCDFSLCAAEKTETKIKPSKPKICTLFFCGIAVGHYMPSSGRKVAPVSVTEGACETEKQQKAAVLPVCEFWILFFVLIFLDSFKAEKMSVAYYLQNRKRQESASCALSFRHSVPAPSRREPLLVRVFSLCHKENKRRI